MPVIEINDVEDPRLAEYRGLRDRGLLGDDRESGVFVGEQALVVKRMLRMPGVTRSVLIGAGWTDRIAPLAGPEVPVYVAPLDLLKRVAGFNIHRGVLAIGRREAIERRRLDDVVPDRDRLTLLLIEDVNNMDNIGLLFRNAAAFGVDAVILSPGCHDPLYRKSLRVSIGHALAVPFTRSTDWTADLRRLRSERGVTLLAASPHEHAVDLDSIEPPPRAGLVVGQEHRGVSAPTLDLCDHVARIPMAPGVDSLNVAVAAAVCLHRFSNAARC